MFEVAEPGVHRSNAQIVEFFLIRNNATAGFQNSLEKQSPAEFEPLVHGAWFTIGVLVGWGGDLVLCRRIWQRYILGSSGDIAIRYFDMPLDGRALSATIVGDTN
jgi:hypothetical protein